MFLVRPGDRLRPELDGQLDVLHHGRGSWVPAPPTRLPEGRVRWAVTPDETHWQLPDSYAVQALLVDAMAVAAPMHPATPVPEQPLPHQPGSGSAREQPVAGPTVPRQSSTSRRAA
jgi:hypothetical protein